MQELLLQTSLGAVLMAAKGYAAPEVEKAYARARELCRQVGETPLLFPVLRGLWNCYLVRAELRTAQELAEQLLTLAQNLGDPVLLMEAHRALGSTLWPLGELVSAWTHLEEVMALYDPPKHRSLAFLYGADPGVACLSYAAWSLWMLGYPDQALKRIHEALILAQELSHPHSLAFAFIFAAYVHRFRREAQETQERADAAVTLCIEQRIAQWLAMGTILQGGALAEQGKREEGIAQMRQGMVAWRTTRAELGRPDFLALLAEAYEKAGKVEEGLALIAEALAVVNKTGQRYFGAELYRLKGELTLKPSGGRSPAAAVLNTQHRPPSTQTEAEAEVEEARRVGSAHQNEAISEAGTVGGAHPTRETEAEECFWKAIEIARRQQAKSLELRAAMSLSRLWQKQGRKEEARKMLAEIYNWFTEGFDTKDLQEAQGLLEELRH